MHTVTLPHTDLRVSHIALGTAGLGTVTTRDEAFALLDAFVEAGGTFIDTAHVYANWAPGEKHRSEKTIGAWLRARGRPRGVVIATKGGHEDPDLPDTPRVTPELVAADLDGSLECLGLDTIDLYWLHRDDPTRPVGPLIELLNDAARAGKIRHFGCSNWEPARITEANAYAAARNLRGFQASQLLWGLAQPNPGAVTPVHAIMDETSHAFYEHAGLGVVAFTSQARGYFAKAAAGGVDSLSEELRLAFANERTLARFARAQALALRLGTTITAVVLAYIHSQPFTAIPIVGCNTMGQLRDSLSDPDLRLSPAILRHLRDGDALDG